MSCCNPSQRWIFFPHSANSLSYRIAFWLGGGMFALKTRHHYPWSQVNFTFPVRKPSAEVQASPMTGTGITHWKTGCWRQVGQGPEAPQVTDLPPALAKEGTSDADARNFLSPCPSQQRRAPVRETGKRKKNQKTPTKPKKNQPTPHMVEGKEGRI